MGSSVALGAVPPFAASSSPEGVNHSAAQQNSSAQDKLPISEAPVPKTRFFGKSAPKWIDNMRLRARVANMLKLEESFAAKGELVTGEIKHFKPHEREAVQPWVTKKLHHRFVQDDDRYETLESTAEVVRNRIDSEDSETKIFASFIRYKNKDGNDAILPVATASMVPLDNPPMPQYGKGWGADFTTKMKYQGRDLITNLYMNYLQPAAPESGLKLYSEPQNVGLYEKKFGMHAVNLERITDQTNPGETIPVQVFSSVPLQLKPNHASLGEDDVRWEPGQGRS